MPGNLSTTDLPAQVLAYLIGQPGNAEMMRIDPWHSSISVEFLPGQAGGLALIRAPPLVFSSCTSAVVPCTQSKQKDGSWSRRLATAEPTGRRTRARRGIPCPARSSDSSSAAATGRVGRGCARGWRRWRRWGAGALGALGDGNVEVWSRDGRRDETKAWHSYRTPSLACCP